ncbi:hypothetical protein TNIN_438921 [Trichonephila inaurata madagascariensis]|uniref:Uncharacterized protein n=1 Tax=Trichonephila inaurata madagascariensis TaxID=2747483 RepID=A0A8X7C8E3_9ARAC|nr:hypothetical protein TNIN_438921 [Trichonephila inaurata madagascariensis]
MGGIFIKLITTSYRLARKRARGAKNDIVEQNNPNVQLPGPGRNTVSLMRLTGRHISPMGKTPTRQCFLVCCR